jgi:tetratricopeptide (TPR) repeat protein/tRNA A-37 threonylcarbamoyl transferase component Bud32
VYHKGDQIGQVYQVHRVLGEGAFGIVYLVTSLENALIFALKTFRDEYLGDPGMRVRFRKEADTWANLGEHPYLVRAYLVNEIEGRLYIEMEYIAPNEAGLNSLEGYLDKQPPDLAQSLQWSIQSCYGMEHAYSKGIRCHRDIKPSNILISEDMTVKISDFGLAAAVVNSSSRSRTSSSIAGSTVGFTFQTTAGVGGTLTHMPPEQFSDPSSCDERSDIYSFGVVLYQMASQGDLPFIAPFPEVETEGEFERFCSEMYWRHKEFPVPRLDSPVSPIIERCLEKNPSHRYPTFKELRTDLELLLKQQSDEVTRLPRTPELGPSDWTAKGMSLRNLGRIEEALACFDRALAIAPWLKEAWANKGIALFDLCRLEEAIQCENRALELDPMDARPWNEKALCLYELHRFDEALAHYDKALELNSQAADCWSNRGITLFSLGRYEDAIHSYDRALRLNAHDPVYWANKSNSLQELGRIEDALRCIDRALELEPLDSSYWFSKGACLHLLGRFEEADPCFDRALEINPHDAMAWNSKGISLQLQGRFEESLQYQDHAIELDPGFAKAWHDKGLTLCELGFTHEAVACFDRALEREPQNGDWWNDKAAVLLDASLFREAISCLDSALEADPENAIAWFNKGTAQEKLDRPKEAARSFRTFLKMAPPELSSLVSEAQERLRRLKYL